MVATLRFDSGVVVGPDGASSALASQSVFVVRLDVIAVPDTVSGYLNSYGEDGLEDVIELVGFWSEKPKWYWGSQDLDTLYGEDGAAALMGYYPIGFTRESVLLLKPVAVGSVQFGLHVPNDWEVRMRVASF